MGHGDLLLETFFNSPSWVHRKVHVVDHLTPGRIQAKISVDISVPQNLKIPRGEETNFVLPVSLMNKGILRSWWIKESSHGPLLVIGRDESTWLVQQMFGSLLKRLLAPIRSLDDKDFARLSSFIDNSASSPKCSFTELSVLLGEHKEKIKPPIASLLLDVAEMLASSWIVFVQVPDSWPGKRVLLEYGYDDFPNDLPKPSWWKDNDFYEHSLPDHGFARSQHYEVHVPAGLEVKEIALQVQIESGDVERGSPDNFHGGCIARVSGRHATEETPRFGQAKLYYRLRPTSQGIHSFTVLSTIACLLFIALTILIRSTDVNLFLRPEWYESTTVSVILAAPALLLSWMAKTPEAAVVGRALIRLRWVNIALAVALLGVATVLSTRWSVAAWHVIWIIIYSMLGLALLLWVFDFVARRDKLKP